MSSTATPLASLWERLTPEARSRGFPALLALIGGGAIVVGCLLTWLHVGGGVSVGSLSITGTPKGKELLTGKEALVDGVAVVIFGLLLLVNRGKRTLLGLLVVAGGIFAVAIVAFVASSPRDRYIDFAVQKGALAGQAEKVNRSLDNLFDASDQKADLGVGLYIAFGGGVLSVVGGMTGVFGRRKPTPVEEEPEPSQPRPEGLPEEWLAARAEEAAARSATVEEPVPQELVTQPASPPLPAPPPESADAAPWRTPLPAEEPPVPAPVTQAVTPTPAKEPAKPDVRVNWSKPLPDEWTAKAPPRRRWRRRS